MSVALQLLSNCPGSALEPMQNWMHLCLYIAPETALEELWNCSGTEEKLSISSFYFSALHLPWSCSRTAMERLRSCSGRALEPKQDWMHFISVPLYRSCNCSGAALEWFWNCSGIALEGLWKCSRTEARLIAFHIRACISAPQLLWNCSATALEVLWNRSRIECISGRMKEKKMK